MLSAAADDGPGVRSAIGLLMRRHWTIGIVTFAVTALMFAAVLNAPKKYVATAMVLLPPTHQALLGGDAGKLPPAEQTEVDAELAVLRSPILIGKVIDRLRLDNDPEWNAALRTPAAFTALLTKAGISSARQPSGTRAKIIKALERSLSIQQKSNSYVLEVTAVSNNPEKAADVSNAVVDVYLDGQMAKRFAAQAAANEWLSQRLDDLLIEIRQKELALEAFKAKHNLTGLVRPRPDSPAASELSGLERDLEAQRGVYDNFRQRYQELVGMRPAELEQMKQAAEPGTPARSLSLSAPVLFAVSLVLGVMCGLMAGILIDQMDKGVRGAGDALRKTGRRAIASIPVLRASDLKPLPAGSRTPWNYILEKPLSAFAESIRNLRTAIMYSVQTGPAKLVCVTSVRAHDGKTTTALCLAQIAAMSGQKILIIDCDLRRRLIAKCLGLSPSAGVLDVVAGDVSFADAIITDAATGLDILPAIEALYTPKNVFSSPAMAELLSRARARYDLIVLNAPATTAASESRIIAVQSDQTIIVARWSKTPTERIRRVVNDLEESGAFVSGLALNFVNPRAKRQLAPTDTAHPANYASKYFVQ
ncbi:MAG: AAA family ATPase [Caulobacterales bacterium]